MRWSVCFAVLVSLWSGVALAQQEQASAPNGAPLKTMERARSYAVTNESDHTIVAAHARMTNGHERDLIWNKPLNPRQGRNIALPSTDCLARLTIKFKSGRTMETGAPDRRETRIIVTNDALQVTSSASNRPPVH